MNRTALQRLLALHVLALAALAASAAPVDVAGVKLDDALELKGSKLQLNGAGVRYKAVFKVYTAGLYLGQKASTPEEVLAAPGAKRMTITMLREIDANELGKLFTRGVEDNSPKAEMSQLIPGLLRMSQIFSDQKQLKAGDSLHHRLAAGHRHRDLGQQDSPGRADQGAGLLQRADAHLARPGTGRLEAEGRVARKSS